MAPASSGAIPWTVDWVQDRCGWAAADEHSHTLSADTTDTFSAGVTLRQRPRACTVGAVDLDFFASVGSRRRV